MSYWFRDFLLTQMTIISSHLFYTFFTNTIAFFSILHHRIIVNSRARILWTGKTTWAELCQFSFNRYFNNKNVIISVPSQWRTQFDEHLVRSYLSHHTIHPWEEKHKFWISLFSMYKFYGNLKYSFFLDKSGMFAFSSFLCMKNISGICIYL